MRRLLLCYLIGFTSLTVTAQVASVQDGAWNDTNTWDCACVPDFNNGQITISHTVTLTADITISELVVDGTLTINAGVNLTSLGFSFVDAITLNGTINNNGNIDVSDFDFIQVNGTLNNTGTFTDVFSSGTENWLFFNSGSTYDHRYTTTAGTIPMATWDANSTLLISGYTTNVATPTNLGQSFGHVTFNLAGLSGTSLSMGGQLTTVNGNLTFVTTNNRPVYLNDAGTGYTLNIGGNFLLTLGNIFLARNLSTATIVNIDGDLIQNGGNLIFTNGTGAVTVNLTGNLTKTAGSWNATGTGTPVNFIFNRSGSQTVTNSAATSAIISYQVSASTTLVIPSENFLSSTNTSSSFTVASGGQLHLGSVNASGAIQTGTTAGNIRIAGSRTFNSGSTIVYNGVAAQSIGNGHPASIGVNTTINNSAGVTLVSNVTIGGNLILTSGNLNVASNTLTLSANVTPNSNTINVSSASSLVINGTGAFGTFPFPSGDQTFANFTLNRTSSGSVVFGNNVTITGNVILTHGNLNFSNRTLTLSGTFSSGGGLLFSNASSTLTINGNGAFGQLAFSGSGNTLNTLNFDRATSGSASINSNLTITTAFNLLNGDFTNSSGLSLSNNATLTRNSTAQLLGSTIIMANGDRYNLVYTGTAMTTGIEMPTVANDDLRNLTINGGPVTLAQSIIVNGDLILQNSSLNGNGVDIIMAGNPGIWNKQNGTFSPGSGTVIITGNVSVQATSNPQFGNITTNSGATFTARAGIMNISGNLQLDGSSTFNHNNGTLIFNGSATQGIASAGKSFNNITVTKGGGNLQILSTLNLINTLSVTTATTVESGGNLVLISTSDAATGNARIGSLPSGASVTGNVTAQRYMADEGRIYRYISSPVTNASVAQLQDDFPVTGSFTGASTGCSGCTTNSSMFYYDEATAGGLQSGYFQYPIASNTEILQPGRGYTPFVRDDIIPGNVVIDLTGPINQGSIALPVTYTNNGDATADGYNLVGNPFPSSIDWDFVSGWTKTNISNVISVRDNGAGGTFRYWDGSTGSFANGEIATGQGFWVRATASSPSLVVNEQAKTTATATFYRGTEEEIDVLEIILSNGTLFDNAYLRVRPEASNVLDDYDGPKLDNASFDMYTVSEDGIPMAINAVGSVSCDTPIKLGIKDMPNGTFTFSRKALGMFTNYYVELLDKFTQTRVMLDEGTTYQFTTNSNSLSKAEDRFEMTLTVQVPASAALLDNTLHSNYTTGNQWYRNGEPIEGATEPTYTPELSGEYSLSVTIGTCKSVATETFVITGSEDDELSRIRIFPNPTKGIVQIEIRATTQVTADIIDVMGRPVQGINVYKGLDAIWTGSADLSHLEKGMYMVRVFDSHNGMSYRRIVKE